MLEEGNGERDKDEAPNNEVGRDAIHAGEDRHKRLSQVELVFDGHLLPIAQDQGIKPVACSTGSLHHHCCSLKTAQRSHQARVDGILESCVLHIQGSIVLPILQRHWALYQTCLEAPS